MLRAFLSNSIIFLLSFLLISCSSPKKVTGVCKSCKPYYVRDQWHYPQQHYRYDEVGLASWYGPGFHGKPKAHGEIYSQYEMTAAHKTLPLPTIARVTNLETGQSTKVLIDDRGPYVYKGRIIDLSTAAAKEIGVYRKGTAKVRVTALEEESHRFSEHLKNFKNGRCPNGRRWIKIFQQNIAKNPNELVSTVYKYDTNIDVKNKIDQPKLLEKTRVNPAYSKETIDNLLNPPPKKRQLNLQKLKTTSFPAVKKLSSGHHVEGRLKTLSPSSKTGKKKYSALILNAKKVSHQKR
jgi:rare lipoprotein A (peptidoglycan hydrolase)